MKRITLVIVVVALLLLMVMSASDQGGVATVIRETPVVSVTSQDRSEVLMWLPQGRQITDYRVMLGPSVEANGRSSRRWLQVQIDGVLGYVWIGDTDLAEPTSDPGAGWVGWDPARGFVEPILRGCDYQDAVIEAMDWWDGSQKILGFGTWGAVIDRLSTVVGRSTWLGYEDQVSPGSAWGHDIPNDAGGVAYLRMQFWVHPINGVMVFHDRVDMEFRRSSSTGRVFVFLYASVFYGYARNDPGVVVYATDQGELMIGQGDPGLQRDAHLCGEYEVEPWILDWVASWFVPLNLM